MIQELQKESDTTIVINEKDEVGVVEILGIDQEKIDNAIERIKNIIFQPVIDEVYKVTVVKILDFGAVVEFVPGKGSSSSCFRNCMGKSWKGYWVS